MKYITELSHAQSIETHKQFIKNFKPKLNMEHNIPRRIRMDLWTPAEAAIHAAVMEVEKAGADVRLTEAVVLLQKAKDKVADFVDGIK